jgi:hypothetical protein
MSQTRFIVAALIIALLPAVTAFASGPGAILQWSDGSAVVSVQPIDQTVVNGMVVNAWYNGSNTVVLLAQPYVQGQVAQVTFSLYDFYTHKLIGNYTLANGVATVSVPSNITVIYITVGSQTYGPFYVASSTSNVSPPPLIANLLEFGIPIGILVAFAMRGGARNVGMGLIVSSVFITAFNVAMGINNPMVYAVPTIGVVLGALVLWESVQNSG